MERVLFGKRKQREFLKLAIKKLNCVSLRSLLQFGLNTNYSCLKNYYLERRLLPKELFEDLCYLTKLNPKNIKYLNENWGRVKGGKTKRKNR
jgi:hypothetical protein